MATADQRRRAVAGYAFAMLALASAAVACDPGYYDPGSGCELVVSPLIEYDGVQTVPMAGALPEYVAAVGEEFVLSLGVTVENIPGVATVVQEPGGWLPDFSTLTDGAEMAELRLTPRAPQAGSRYTACVQAMAEATQSSVMFEPLLVCAIIKVEAHAAHFTSTAQDPSLRSPLPGTVLDAFVGLEFVLPLEVSAGVAGASSPEESPLPPAIDPLPDQSYPRSMSGLPHGATLTRRLEVNGIAQTDDNRPQFWLLRWVPGVEDAAGVRRTVCLAATLGGAHGEHRCFPLHVHKCRHSLSAGDTLERVAVQYKADWLQLHHANPNLPSLNPDKTRHRLLVRLGVTYTVRPGEDLPHIAQKFLVEPTHLGLVNPELVAPTQVSYSPGTAGDVTQLDLVIALRRRVMAGENISVPLHAVDGAPWSGAVTERCTPGPSTLPPSYCPAAPALQRAALPPGCCSESTHQPLSRCGAGGWGECRYDADGVMACHALQCQEPPHPFVAKVTWTGPRRELHVTVGQTIDAGQEFRLSVPRSAALRLSPSLPPLPEVDAAVPLPERMWDPVAGAAVASELCVVLPLCHRDLDCAFGTDCALRVDRHDATRQ